MLSNRRDALCGPHFHVANQLKPVYIGLFVWADLLKALLADFLERKTLLAGWLIWLIISSEQACATTRSI
jgi:hypothetical protein